MGHALIGGKLWTVINMEAFGIGTELSFTRNV